MRPLYMDITNIPELKRYTGISRVVSEIAAKFIADGVDVRLIAYSTAKHAYRLIDNDRFLLAANGMLDDKKKCYTDILIKPEDMEKNAIFFDANSTWHTMPNRSSLLPVLKKLQIRIVPLIHDIIPIRCPQYMVPLTLMRFMEFLTAHMTYADEIFVTTDTVRSDLTALFGELGLPVKPIRKIGLGADFSTGKSENSPDETIDPEAVRIVQGRRFLLTVGTVEPRKNQKVLIEAYEKKLADMDIDVIVVGHIGWEMEGMLKRIKSNPKYGNGLYLFTNANDATLNFLYSKAFMVIFPSYIEGYGLPTIEALINGIPIACSDIGVMREVGGEFCDYFHPDSSDQLIEIVRKYAESDELYRARRRQLRTEYHPPKWQDTAAAYEKIFFGENSSDKFEHKPVKQIVFLSARPKPILETLPYIEEFMPFIKELVVCCPDDMADYMKKYYDGRLTLTTVTDNELLNGRTLPPDHSTRNFFLRCLAMELDVIDDEFIMCDDDYRPMKPISEEVFYSDGKYNGYYFSDISKWHYMIPKLFSYDFCHFRTLGFLRRNGYATLQYSSHQPQIINKVWYREMIAKYPDIITKGYDEWSTYFNYISAVHREQFRPCPYVTLSWPNIGGENKGVYQPDYLFENFYSENYTSRHTFEGFNARYSSPEQIVEESREKKLIALKFKAIHDEEQRFADAYAADYEKQFRELPSVALYFGGNPNKPPEVGVPAYIRLSYNKAHKIRISAAREKWCSANILTAYCILQIIDENGRVYCNHRIDMRPRLNYSYQNVIIPAHAPSDVPLRLKITAGLSTSPLNTEKFIPINITD